jgi:NADPH-dependent 7-cyano-7-deazaguanine reductase QueF
MKWGTEMCFETLTSEKRLRIDTITYRPAMNMVCPVADDKYRAEITITYIPARGGEEKFIEYISFEAWLKELEELFKFTVEKLARVIFDEVASVIVPHDLIVKVHAVSETHSPVVVEISAMQPRKIK